ncbi:hypothetical protein [Paracoccus sp. (in: a-proteobacteria)]|uniref:hypothetical protein n=1 Tax=Paracoccus sp. TaxID=267 RepID=UPI00396CCEFE
MAISRIERRPASLSSTVESVAPPKPPRRSEAKPKPAAISRANEIVRAIGLRPITGLSGPKIGY